MRLLPLFVLLVACSAFAVSKGGTLYVKSKDTKLLDAADAKSKTKATLQPGDAVTWLGADAKNKLFHKVKTDKGAEGFLLQTTLSPKKPQDEALAKDDGKSIDAKAFASSGAATKALSEAGLKYAEKKQSQAELVKGLSTAEGIAATVDTASAAAFNAKSVGGAK